MFINLSQIHNSHLGSSIKLHSVFHLPIRILLVWVKFAEEHCVLLSQEVPAHAEVEMESQHSCLKEVTKEAIQKTGKERLRLGLYMRHTAPLLRKEPGDDDGRLRIS